MKRKPSFYEWARQAIANSFWLAVKRVLIEGTDSDEAHMKTVQAALYAAEDFFSANGFEKQAEQMRELSEKPMVSTEDSFAAFRALIRAWNEVSKNEVVVV